MVRSFAHGAMGRRIDPSWGGPNDWCNWYLVILFGDNGE